MLKSSVRLFGGVGRAETATVLPGALKVCYSRWRVRNPAEDPLGTKESILKLVNAWYSVNLNSRIRIIMFLVPSLVILRLSMVSSLSR